MQIISVPCRRFLYALFVACYVVYPFWYAGPTPAFKLGLLAAFLVLPAALLKAARFLDGAEIKLSLPSARDIGWLTLALLAGVALLHLPLWALQIPMDADDQYHAGPPAYFLYKISRWIPLIWLRIAVLAAAALCLLAWRKGLFSGRRPAIALASLGLAALAVYFFALTRYRLIDHVGELTTLLVYAPLSRLIYLSGYTIFGIHEIVPYAAQFLFMCGAAGYMWKTARLTEIELDRNVFLLFCLLFPTFFYFSTCSLLACGVIFFYCGAVYHFLRFALLRGEEDALNTMCLLTVGMLYKNELAVFWLIIIAFSALLFAAGKWDRSVFLRMLRFLAIPLIFFIPYILTTPLWGVSGQPMVFSNLIHGDTFFINARNALLTTGPLLSVFILAAALWAAARLRGSVIFWFLAFLAASHYLLIAATIGNTYIRHSQPSYIPFVFAGALSLSAAFVKARRPVFKGVIVLAAAAALLYPDFWQKAPLQRVNLTNRYDFEFPYPEAVDFLGKLAEREGPLTLYAPYSGQPSHFYIAKAPMNRSVTWLINPLLESADEAVPGVIHERCKASGSGYFLFPEHRVYRDAGTDTGMRAEPRLFVPVRDFESHGNVLRLYKVL